MHFGKASSLWFGRHPSPFPVILRFSEVATALTTDSICTQGFSLPSIGNTKQVAGGLLAFKHEVVKYICINITPVFSG